MSNDVLKLNGHEVVTVQGLPAVTGWTLDGVRMRLKRDLKRPPLSCDSAVKTCTTSPA